MSKQLKTLHLVLIASIAGGILFALDSHYKAAIAAENRAIDIAAACFGIREYEVKSSGVSVELTAKCTENTMILSDMGKGRNDT